MIKVGITGGIGSGKSTICKFFELLGIPVFVADTEAKRITESSPLVRAQLREAFGKDIYLPDLTLNRKRLAGILFDAPELLRKAGDIIHPEVRKYFFEWVANQNSPYIIYEAAILFESGSRTMFDFTVLVTAPLQERLKRVEKRDRTNEEDIMRRVATQWTDEKKAKFADYIINNDNRELIIPALLELDRKLRTTYCRQC